jgi:hypothetical protein
MAKFSGKNIEFLDNQKAIFGSEDDSAIQWDNDNAQLTINTVVSGVDPTADGHLITRRYLEDVLLGTSSGTEQVGNLLFGSEFQYELSEGQSSTNSTAYQNKVSITVTDIPEGSYRLGWHFEWRISKSNRKFEYRIQQDNTTNLKEDSISPFVDVTVWNPVTNFYYLETVSSGIHTFGLDYSSSSTNSTAYIREARLEFWRVT